MNTVKSTLMLKEHYPDMEIKVFYIDIRAFGKGFEDLYTRSRRLGVKYIRGLPGTVEEDDNKGLRVAVENTSHRRLEMHDLDMLVLALGMKPAGKTQKLQEMLGLQLTGRVFSGGAPQTAAGGCGHPGRFYAGCAEGPKDIKESVTQASAAAARVIRLMHKGEITTEPITSMVIEEKCTSCGKCAKVCPYNAITVDVKRKIPASVNTAACAGCGTCAAECKFDAIVMNHFTDEQILEQSHALLETEPQGKNPGLCLQLVLLCGSRLCGRIPVAVSSQRTSDPHHVFRPCG
jgi:heterodisulfide reductase subunit A